MDFAMESQGLPLSGGGPRVSADGQATSQGYSLLCQCLQGAQADIAALVRLFKADLLCRLIGMAQRIGQPRAGGGDTQHTAAGRDKGCHPR